MYVVRNFRTHIDIYKKFAKGRFTWTDVFLNSLNYDNLAETYIEQLSKKERVLCDYVWI